MQLVAARENQKIRFSIVYWSLTGHRRSFEGKQRRKYTHVRYGPERAALQRVRNDVRLSLGVPPHSLNVRIDSILVSRPA